LIRPRPDDAIDFLGKRYSWSRTCWLRIISSVPS
jgi:hypothetical protein